VHGLSPANAERGERRAERGLLVAGERDQVAIIERLAADDPGELGGRPTAAFVAATEAMTAAALTVLAKQGQP
jgi:hypothetical protein